ncbi:hypothetical protein MINS_16910 [Mycolicibacterium insubricum]|jgi:hypothetical protein|nr:hypothetical protein MINS_16910 [Mycolicibacterium insubricum]
MGDGVGMMRPRWNDSRFSAGTMVRGALWLLDVVGEGNVFTKEQVRSAFPGVSQADRRIRDLRDYGWTIFSSSDDATLELDEQRFVAAGIAVWDPAARRQAQAKAITAKERHAAMAADGFQCVVCGVGGGETYPDSPNETAVLGTTRRPVGLPDGSSAKQLVTECKRCRAGDGSSRPPADIRRLIEDARNLEDDDRNHLHRWVERGRRGPTPLDRLWNAYRQLPAEARHEFERSFDT